jgi:hypothetical protein
MKAAFDKDLAPTPKVKKHRVSPRNGQLFEMASYVGSIPGTSSFVVRTTGRAMLGTLVFVSL